jgi:cytochrome b
MKHDYTNTLLHNPKNFFWSKAVRVLHWLTSISLVGASSYTKEGDSWHSELGWMSLALLIILHSIYAYSGKTNLALWVVTALVTATNLSGWLSPYHTSHIMLTLSGVMLAAFYFATVVFESLSLLISRILNQGQAT